MTLLIRPRVDEDDAAVLDIQHRIQPDLPGETLEEHRFYLDRSPLRGVQEVWTAVADGAVMGQGHIQERVSLQEPGIFAVSVVVDPERWGQGIGGALYARIEERARALGARRMLGDYRENSAHSARFVTARGYTPTGEVERMSRLHVPHANLDAIAGAEGRLRADGIEIATLAELGPENEALLRALHALDEEATRDMPGSQEYGGTSFERWRRFVLEAPWTSPGRIWLAMAGERPVGLAFLPLRSGVAENAFTAIARDYRGRGIARALKARTVRWARENGIEWIYTGNNAENAPMLSINVRLGYEPLPPFIEVAKELA